MQNEFRKPTSINVDSRLYLLTKVIATNLTANHSYTNIVDIIEVSLFEFISNHKELLPQEYHSRLEDIKYPNRLPKLK